MISLISNTAPNLHSVIGSKMNIASNYKQKTTLKGKGSYEFMFSLETVTFYRKEILQLII